MNPIALQGFLQTLCPTHLLCRDLTKSPWSDCCRELLFHCPFSPPGASHEGSSSWIYLAISHPTATWDQVRLLTGRDGLSLDAPGGDSSPKPLPDPTAAKLPCGIVQQARMDTGTGAGASGSSKAFYPFPPEPGAPADPGSICLDGLLSVLRCSG